MNSFHSILAVLVAATIISPTKSPAQADDVIAPAQPAAVNPEQEPAVRKVLPIDSMRAAVAASQAAVNRMVWPIGDNGKGSQILLVQHKAMDADAASALGEDLSVMSRILQKTVERIGGRESEKALGIVLSTSPGSRSPQSIYLEGYGAVFMLNVRFPLMVTGDGEEKEVKHRGNSAWDEARREVLGHRSSFGPDTFGKDRTAVPYNHDQVEELKKDLVTALKDVSNIRGLKADDFITVVVSGGGDRSGGFFHAAIPQNQNQFELDELSAHLDGLSARFTDQHPRVVAQKAKVDDLKKQIASDEINETHEARASEDEAANVNVNGRSDSVKRKSARAGQPRSGATTKVFSYRNNGGTPPSTLTVRIKKSDAESMATGKLESADFAKRALVTVY